jgi:hypothetical protein
MSPVADDKPTLTLVTKTNHRFADDHNMVGEKGLYIAHGRTRHAVG